MAKRGVLSAKTLGCRLDDGYARFVAWCAQNGKTTAIDIWTRQKLDMESILGRTFTMRPIPCCSGTMISQRALELPKPSTRPWS